MSVASARQSIPTFRCNLCLSIQKMFEPMTAGSGNNRTPAAKQYFTSCFHLLCNSCRFKNLQNCAFCNRSCQFMGCSSNMPKQYQLYFKPILYAKRQFITVLKFQRTQNSIAKRRLAAKVVYIEKKRAMAMQKVKERQERCQRAKEMEHKLQTAHQILCQEKRRREEEKQRRQHNHPQQSTQNPPRQQQQQHYQQSQCRLQQHQQQQQQHPNRQINCEPRHVHQPVHASRPHHPYGHSNNHQQQRPGNLNTTSSTSSISDITIPSSFGLGS